MNRITSAAPFCIEPRRQLSTSARIRTLCGSFGGCLLSQEHARRSRVAGGNRTLAFWFTARCAGPLHHSHHRSDSCEPRCVSTRVLPQAPGADASRLALIRAPSRSRTCNVSFVARYDVPFTTGATSGRRGIRTLTPLRARCLANRSGNPYPAAFRLQWTHRELNPDRQPAELASSRWTMGPFQWTAGESNPDHPRAKPVSSR